MGDRKEKYSWKQDSDIAMVMEGERRLANVCGGISAGFLCALLNAQEAKIAKAKETLAIYAEADFSDGQLAERTLAELEETGK